MRLTINPHPDKRHTEHKTAIFGAVCSAGSDGWMNRRLLEHRCNPSHSPLILYVQYITTPMPMPDVIDVDVCRARCLYCCACDVAHRQWQFRPCQRTRVWHAKSIDLYEQQAAVRWWKVASDQRQSLIFWYSLNSEMDMWSLMHCARTTQMCCGPIIYHWNAQANRFSF